MKTSASPFQLEVHKVPKNKKAKLDPLGRFYSVKVTLYLAQFLLIS